MINLEFPFIKLHIESIDAWSDQYYSEERLPQDFPYCCEEHKKLAKEIYDWWDKFPLCCDSHKKLLLDKDFRKDKYFYSPKKILNQLAFFRKHIDLHIDKPNWFNEIKDYYVYVNDSFGKPPIGLGLFNYYIKFNLLSLKELPDCKYDKMKLQKIADYIHDYDKPEYIQTKESDLEELYKIFAKWVDIVPNIGPFVNLKTNIQGKFPINLMFKEHYYNKYINSTIVKFKSFKELNQDLFKLTNEALNSIDSSWFIKNKKIQEFNEFKIDVINENHRLRQNTLLNDFTKSQSKYIELIENWLKNENKYFKEISPLLEKLTLKASDNNKECGWFKYIKYHNPDKLKYLYEHLSKLGSVKDQYMNFKLAFSGNPVDKKVIWTGYKGDLTTLIRELNKQDKIEKVDDIWSVSINTFCDSELKDFDSLQLKNGTSTKNFDKIRKIVSNL